MDRVYEWEDGKTFEEFRSVIEFVSDMLEVAETQCLYEIIRRDRPCKAYQRE